jgi:hypothetical protein
MDELLQQLGFTRNPFGMREADRESHRQLASYFFQHQLFDTVLGSVDSLETVILLAERGAGKTTFRQAIEYFCRAGRRPVEDVLDVSYTNFSRPLQRARKHGRPVDIFTHVDENLSCAVMRLLEAIDTIGLRQFEQLPASDFATLSAYVRRYSRLLQPDDYGRTAQVILRRFAAASLDTDGPDDELEHFDASGLFGEDPASVIARLPALLQPAANLLVRLQQQPPRRLGSNSYLQLMRDFLELLCALGYRAMYVLDDRLDETALLDSPAAVVGFVKPLLTDVKLLDEPNLAFKIFLPQHLDPYLAVEVDFRRKRLAVRHLAWSGDDLLSLLTRRLQGASRYHVGSMQAFCEPSLGSRVVYYSSAHPQARYVDVALVEAANHLPRDLILRCRELFAIYEARASLGLITEDDLDQAIRADLGSDAPPMLASGPVRPTVPSAEAPTSDGPAPPLVGLYIDRYQNVWRDGQRLAKPLSEMEFRFLNYLCAHRYQLCALKDILEAVWGPDHEMDTLRTTLRRLRQTVEEDPRHPRFLVTRHGLGLQLEDG